MKRERLLFCGSAIATLLASAGPAAAQGAAPAQIEEVVVTGSLIQGASEDAALPVTAITAQDLQKQGSPTSLELLKALPIVGATIGEANPLGSSRSEGTASVNLRGLSPVRTLVLFNGRRLAPINSGTASLTDVNTLPMAAVGRIEVLKDGGAATYGSDAVAGVINFITRRNLDGFEAQASYAYVKGSDGDVQAKLNWGQVWDRGNILVSLGYQHRSELRATDRDWAQPDYLENPTAWSTATNPGIYSVGNAAATAVSFLDPGCAAAGGVVTPLPSVGIARNCLFQATAFQNIVDEQNLGQAYAEVNYRVTDDIEAHLEAFYSRTHARNVATAPSISPTVFPTTASTGGPAAGVIPGRYYIPATNPGLVDLLNRYTSADLGLTAAQYAAARTSGVNAGPNWRPIGLGGNPTSGSGATLTHRDFQVYRVSGGFKGKVPFAKAVDWDLNLTYGEARADSPGVDTLVSRLEYALRGLGGPGCTPGGSNAATSTPGAGPCQYFNPFSTGLQANALTGQANPGFVGRPNSADLVDWFTDPNSAITTNGIFTTELVLSGRLGFLALPGGKVGWAAGAQYRANHVKVSPSDISNLLLNPCIDEGAPISTCASSPSGPFSIFGANAPRDYNQEAKGVYGELSLPITDDIQVQLALRHEKHEAGTTTNPKIAVRWQVFPMLALRASAESTYRAPPLAALDPAINTTVSQAVGTIRVPFIRQGNPDLKPETADNWSAGAILSLGDFRATVDYWRYLLRDQLIIEDGPSLVNALLPASGGNRCADPAFAALRARFTFNSVGCGQAVNIARVVVLNANGPKADLSGIDVVLDYRIRDVWEGDLSFGADFTYNINYKVGGIQQFGTTLAQPFDAVGKLNSGIQPLALPQWRVQAFAEFDRGPHSLRLQVRYADSIVDQRAGSGTASDITAQVPGFPTGTRVLGGVKIKGFLQNDVHYTWRSPWDATFSLSVLNVFDKDPPLARTELSYDAFTANPLGRVIKFGVQKTF